MAHAFVTCSGIFYSMPGWGVHVCISIIVCMRKMPILHVSFGEWCMVLSVTDEFNSPCSYYTE